MICPACGQENPPRAKFCNECGTGLDNDEAVEPTAIQLISSGFVGRRQEMAQLLAALADARGGRGRVVMLVGEPGIGKTTTAEELAAIATAQEWQIMWGRCHEGEGAPPYWPWLQPLREYVQRTSPDQIMAQMGPGSADIAEILPELKVKLPDPAPPPALEAEQARFRLFDSTTKFLKNIALSQPLVLILEDLHWADRSSLLLLEFLVKDIQSTPMLVIGTYRDVEVSRRHPLSETLGTLIRSQGFLRLHLTGLDEPEVAQLIQRGTKDIPSPGLSAAIHGRTEGNPLFVGEIIRMLPQEGKQAEADYLGAIPEGVRDAIGRRLNRLSEDCNDLLTIASVLGQEFTLEQLHPLLEGWTRERRLEVTEEALTARVVEEIPGSVGAYQFAHALIQETLVAELSTTRRVQLHATIAESLEELYRDAFDLHAAELAFHFAEAQTLLGPDKLVRYSLMAGEQALTAYAYEESLKQFERGLEVRRGVLTSERPARDAEEAALLLGLGRALGATRTYSNTDSRRVNDIVGYVTQAFNYYEESGEIELAVKAASFDFFGYNTGYIVTDMVGLVERALKLVPEDSHQSGYLWAQYIRLLGHSTGNYDACKAAAERALTIAHREHDAELEVRALSFSTNMDMFHLRFPECQKNGIAAIGLAAQVEDMDSVARAHFFVGMSHLHLGETSQARRHGEAGLELLHRPIRKQQHTIILFLSQFLAYLEGNWPLAREFADRGLQVNTFAPYLLGVRALTEFETGNTDEAEPVICNLLENMRRIPAGTNWEYAAVSAVLPIAARITGVTEQIETADTAGRAVLSAQNVTPWVAHHVQLSQALISLQRFDSYQILEHRYTDLQNTVGMPSLFGTTPDRVLGLLSQAMDKPSQAESHFQSALAFCKRAGYRPELAWTCCDYADTLLERNQPKDQERARSLLEESLSITAELGMVPLMERVQSRLVGLGTGRSAYPDGLTQREVEVLTLIAQGKNNREIGEALFITEATARRHVSNIYDKIGVSNRAEATRYAIDRGLVS